MKKAFVGTLAVALLALTGLSIAGEEPQYEVKGGKGTIEVSTKGKWHVNKEFPWNVKSDGKVVADKSKVSFAEQSAKISGLPAGTLHLKGAVCLGTEQCVPFEKDVKVD
jgi:hypothetical protein